MNEMENTHNSRTRAARKTEKKTQQKQEEKNTTSIKWFMVQHSRGLHGVSSLASPFHGLSDYEQ